MQCFIFVVLSVHGDADQSEKLMVWHIHLQMERSQIWDSKESAQKLSL